MGQAGFINSSDVVGILRFASRGDRLMGLFNRVGACQFVDSMSVKLWDESSVFDCTISFIGVAGGTGHLRKHEPTDGNPKVAHGCPPVHGRGERFK